MKYNKQPISFSAQVAQLKNKGLIFGDEKAAELTLSRISYYRLRAYTYPFQDNKDPNHPFIQEISFEEIIDLYRFDRELRVLVFDAIEKIEVALRTQIIYQFAMTNGSHWQTDPNLYRDTARFTKHLGTLQKEIDRSEETFIKHYKSKYKSPSQPPSWMSLEVASMGTLSKIYQNLKKGQEKRAVARSFGIKQIDIMENWMFCFSSLRNICAHHGRLWNRRMSAIIKLTYNTKGQFLTKQEVKMIYTNKLYAVLCAVKYMLDQIDSTNGFSDDLKNLVRSCPVCQEKEMGFIKNWDKHPLWN
jgi:abortive infection bacteriophage resistance protein